VIGVVTFLDHTWTEKFSTSVGYSMIDVATPSCNRNSFERGHYGILNLMYYPVKNLMTGTEFQWGRRKNVRDGWTYDDYRVRSVPDTTSRSMYSEKGMKNTRFVSIHVAVVTVALLVASATTMFAQASAKVSPVAPKAEQVQAVINQAYEKFKTNTEGKTPTTYPNWARSTRNFMAL